MSWWAAYDEELTTSTLAISLSNADINFLIEIVAPRP